MSDEQTTASKLYDRIGPFVVVPESFILAARHYPHEVVHLYVVLRLHINRRRDSDEVFPSYARLREETGMTYNTIAKCIRFLIEAGWLERLKRPGYVSIYTMVYRDYDAVKLELSAFMSSTLPGDTSMARHRGSPMADHRGSPMAHHRLTRRSNQTNDNHAGADGARQGDDLLQPSRDEEARIQRAIANAKRDETAKQAMRDFHAVLPEVPFALAKWSYTASKLWSSYRGDVQLLKRAAKVAREEGKTPLHPGGLTWFVTRMKSQAHARQEEGEDESQTYDL